MCSSTNVARKHESTTWAASVPLDDLAHAIKAAVGVQPVRQLASPALLKSVEQQQPQQQQQQQCSINPTFNSVAGSTVNYESAKQPLRDAVQTHAPLPVRRPTLAEVRAASPVDSTASDLCRTDSSTSSRSSSISDVDSACMQLLLSQQQQWPQLAEPASPAYFDNMDDMQQQLQDCLPSLHSSNSSSHLQDCVHNSGAYLELSCNGHGALDTASNQQYQQQKELLCKIWSELQLPVQHDEQDYLQQAQQQLSPDSVLLLDTAGSIIGSSCCSSGVHFATRATAQGQYAGKASSSSPRTSLESSCCSSRAMSPDSAASEDSTGAVSCCSTRSSRSSSRERKQRRVSWGPVTEYQLPAAATQTSILDCLPSWVQDRLAGVSSSRRDTQALVSAAGLVVCLAGAAAFIYARRA